MDPIADMFTRITNGYKAGHETVIIPYSKMKEEVARILQERSFISGSEKKGKKIRKFLELTLRYNSGAPAIIQCHSISKVSRRLYVGNDKIPHVRYGYGMVIISTSRGLMTGDDAKKQRLGGELVAEVW